MDGSIIVTNGGVVVAVGVIGGGVGGGGGGGRGVVAVTRHARDGTCTVPCTGFTRKTYRTSPFVGWRGGRRLKEQLVRMLLLLLLLLELALLVLSLSGMWE